jgi:phosphatidate cytidylyltransferase
MHAKRWITGIIAFPLFVWLIFKGGTPMFALLIAAASVVGMYEYQRIVLPVENKTVNRLITIFGLVLAPFMILGAYLNLWPMIMGVLVFNLLFTALLSLPQFKDTPAVVDTVVKQGLGFVYIPLLLSYLVLVHQSGAGALWIFFTICLVFAGDTGAFYSGSYLGKHKLCPAVSPNKTIEGALGGMSATLLIAVIFKLLFFDKLDWGTLILFAILVSSAGQVGDLFESELKRAANVKDSGTLLPGHGGVLDRIDALLFAAPLVYYFKIFIFNAL